MPGRKFAILAGISSYEHQRHLDFTVKDVEDVRGVLIDAQRGGYAKDDVKVLTDEEELKPNRTNLRHIVDLVAKQAGDDDQILFYFSGHGFVVDSRVFLVPIDGMTEYPADSCLALEWVQDTLERSKARVKVLVLDACYSGLELGKAGAGVMTKEFQSAIAKMAEAEGFVVLASCSASQVSSEDSALGHGVFSYYLTEGLKGPADSDHDYDISIWEAYDYVQAKVNAWAFSNETSQTPTCQTKIAGDIKLVDVPKPSAGDASFGVAIIANITITKRSRQLPSQETQGMNHEELLKSTMRECGQDVARIGATLAQIYGPTTIHCEDDYHCTFPDGEYIGMISEERNGSTTYATHMIFSKDSPSKDETLDKVLKRLGSFDQVVYLMNGKLDLVRIYDVLKERGLSIEQYNPRTILAAKSLSFPKFDVVFENTTTEARVCITTEFISHIVESLGPSKLQEIIHASSPKREES